MTALVITVDVRSVYGRDTIYPADEAARAFARIAGTTTLTPDVLKEIIGLGYEVRYCQFKPVLVMRDGSHLPVVEKSGFVERLAAARAEGRWPQR